MQNLIALREEFTLCVARENGITLADLLRQLAASPALLQASRRQLEEGHFQLHKFVPPQLALEPLWRELLFAYTCSVVRHAQGESGAAYGDMLVSIQLLHRIFAGSTRWMLPVVYHLNELFWSMARSLGSRQSEEAARLINKSLTICLTDRGALGVSRKWGFYRLAALLFRIYFVLDQLNLCGNVLRAMGAADLPDPLRYPSAHLVTFRYWLGRFHFVSGEYAKAEAELTLAWAHCPAEAAHNKRLILYFLLPLRLMLTATYPSPALLHRHGLPPDGFYPVAISLLRAGRVVEYHGLLQQREPELLRLGTFPIWEKLVLIAHRNLLRRICRLLGTASAAASPSATSPAATSPSATSPSAATASRVPVSLLVSILTMMGAKQDPDEVSCLLAVLIDRGLIKGYISHEKATLVLSLKDPFPPMAAAQISK